MDLDGLIESLLEGKKKGKYAGQVGPPPPGVTWKEFLDGGGIYGTGPARSKPKPKGPKKQPKYVRKILAALKEVAQDIVDWFKDTNVLSKEHWVRFLKDDLRTPDAFGLEYVADWVDKDRKRLAILDKLPYDTIVKLARGKWLDDDDVAPLKKAPATSKPWTKQPAQSELFGKPAKPSSSKLIAETHPRWGRHWVVPKGGVDIGETVKRGAEREVFEETGVRANTLGPPFVMVTRPGGSGRYDLPLVMKTLKDKFPKHAELFDKHTKRIESAFYPFVNHNHFFVMRYRSGKPYATASSDEHGEIGRAEWVPMREAVKRSHRIKKVVDGLLPKIKRRFEKLPGKPPGKSRPKLPWEKPESAIRGRGRGGKKSGRRGKPPKGGYGGYAAFY
jgi:8-oxo-dGTP pyrophosphatase MutT (NUDIX family)